MPKVVRCQVKGSNAQTPGYVVSLTVNEVVPRVLSVLCLNKDILRIESIDILGVLQL